MYRIKLTSIIAIFALSQTHAQSIKTTSANWRSEKTYLQPNAAAFVEDITYFNELGYPTQQIGIQASPTGYNILQPIYYDEVLRDSVRNYLPVVTESTTGQMLADPFLLSRYQQTYGTTENGYVYHETTYDNSITNRRVASTNVGSIFRERQKSASYKYELSRNDDVLKIKTASSSGFTVNGMWSNGELQKISFKNEDGAQTIRFTDSRGNVILSRVTDGTECVDTYFVYDPLDRLSWVISPECSYRLTAGSYSLDSLCVSRYCYHYVYDSRNRVVFKKIPGCDAEQYVYDRNDQPVMTQDGNMRKSNGWTYVQYDPHGRPETTYYLELANKTRAQLQALFDVGQTDELQNDSTKQMLSRCYYDGIADDGTYSPINEAIFRPIEDVLTASDVNRDRRGYKTREELAVLNRDAGYNNTIYRTFYYDHRGRPIQTIERNCLGYESCTTIKYDFCGNILKIHESHKVTSSQQPDILLREYTYDNRGRKLSETTTLNGCAPVVVNYAYDSLGRLSSTATGSGEEARTTTYAYNLQGWLTQKSSPDLTLDYRYYKSDNLWTRPSYTGNIAETMWYRNNAPKKAVSTSYFYDGLTRLAKAKHFQREQIEVTAGSQDGTSDTFTSYIYMYTDKNQDSLVYDRNGNITLYAHEGKDIDPLTRRYTYKGNQMDWNQTEIQISGPLDPIEGFNSLKVIPEDLIKGPFDGIISYIGNYEYDSNGNMTYDLRHSLNIRYNRLNLVEKVIHADTVYANYSYLADGTKLTASDKDGNGYVYMGSLVYRREDAREPFIKLDLDDNAISTQGFEDFAIIRYYYDLESVPFDGGRLTVSKVAGSNIYTPRYYSTDHLGSVRTVVDGGSGETVEKNDYDPFGSRIVDAENEISDNRYRYNGKEEQAFLKLPYIDYGARMYDPKIAMRWNRPDPLAEKYPGISPYAFCANNPINFVDPDGQDWYSYYDDNNDLQYIYKDHQLSKQEMTSLKLTRIGITGKTKDGSQYLSLFGEKLDAKTPAGRNNLLTEAVSNLDRAIINSYKADYMNAHQEDTMFPEVYSGNTDMRLSMTVTSANVRDRTNIFTTNYEGGTMRYEASNTHQGGSFDWGDGCVRPISGYYVTVGHGAAAKVSNGANVSVYWIFPTTSAWQNARDRANKLLYNRRW